MRTKIGVAALAVVISGIVGCAPADDPITTATVSPTPWEYKPTAPAGVALAAPAAPADPRSVLVARNFTKRLDPFALKPNERQFERDQETLRVFDQMGQFTVQYTPPPEETQKPEDIPEPQPYRRLAGVVVGDSILALIDMGGGQLEVIRPGQMIPNSEWRVVSIDSEKAVLRRSGNRTPRQIIVRLESPPPGMGGGFPGGGLPGGPGGPMGPGGPGGRPGQGVGGGGRPGAGFGGGSTADE